MRDKEARRSPFSTFTISSDVAPDYRFNYYAINVQNIYIFKSLIQCFQPSLKLQPYGSTDKTHFDYTPFIPRFTPPARSPELKQERPYPYMRDEDGEEGRTSVTSEELWLILLGILTFPHQ